MNYFYILSSFIFLNLIGMERAPLEQNWKTLNFAITQDFAKDIETHLQTELYSREMLTQALVFACGQNALGAAKVLIRYGALIDGIDNQRPLLAAVVHQNTALVELLLRCGADANKIYTPDKDPQYVQYTNINYYMEPEAYKAIDIAKKLAEQEQEWSNSFSSGMTPIQEALTRPINYYSCCIKDQILQTLATDVELAIRYDDTKALFHFLKNLNVPAQFKKPQHYLNYLLMIGANKKNNHAIHLLISFGAQAGDTYIQSVSNLDLETVKEFYRKKYVSPLCQIKSLTGENPITIAQKARADERTPLKEHQASKMKMVSLIENPASAIFVNRTSKNICDILEKRRAGCQKFLTPGQFNQKKLS